MQKIVKLKSCHVFLEATSFKCLCFPIKRLLTQMEDKSIYEDPLRQVKLVQLAKVVVWNWHVLMMKPDIK